MKKQKNNSTDKSLRLETYIRDLKEADPLRESILLSAIKALNIPERSKGLDAGCGIGLQSLLLAKEVGSHCHITGLDITPEFVHYANNRVRELGLTRQITFKEGDVTKLPFEDNTFDWVWSADCAGYPVTDHPNTINQRIKESGKTRGYGSNPGMVFTTTASGVSVVRSKTKCSLIRIFPFNQGEKARAVLFTGIGLVC